MDHRGDLANGGCQLNQGLDRLAGGNVDDSRGDLEACVEQHLGRRIGVLLPQVGQYHVFARADTAGNCLANGACAYDDGDVTGVLHEYLE